MIGIQLLIITLVITELVWVLVLRLGEPIVHGRPKLFWKLYAHSPQTELDDRENDYGI